MSRYTPDQVAKAIVALIAAVAVVATQIVDAVNAAGGADSSNYLTIAVAVLGAIGVYAKGNANHN